jgi:APA family basic amino acid/polyamine antiporter
MAKTSLGSQEENLKRVLGTKDVIGLAVGLIIGAGVMSLTGVAIGKTGTGTVFAFLLSAALMVLTTLPIAQLGAAAPSAGGSYKYVSRLLGSKWGFLFIMLYIPTYICLSVYAISFAQYFQVLIPGADAHLTAGAVMTVFYIINILGTKKLSFAQNLMVVLLVAALAAFIGFGLPKVDYAAVFASENLLPAGAGGFLTATALLSFAMVGASFLGDLGGEMKNPSRDIPLGIIVATLGVGLLYALIAIVACGVLPWREVADRPLSAVAQRILSSPLFYLFVIGGGLGATATTINGTLGYVTKPLVIACQDGWLPRRLGAVNKKTGTPIYLLTLFYVVGMIPILFGFSLSTASNLCTGIGMFAFSFPSLAACRLTRKYPGLYENSAFKLPRKMLSFLGILGFAVSIVQGLLLLSEFKRVVTIGLFAYMLAAFLIGWVSEKRVPIPADLKAMEAVRPAQRGNDA